MAHIIKSETAAEVASSIADRIKASGVTVVWLCDRTGIPRSTMNRRLSHPADFTLSELNRVADALRVDFTELFTTESVA